MTGRSVGDPTPLRKWVAIFVATVVMAASAILIVTAFVEGAAEGGESPVPMLSLGLALVPFAFMTLAFLSKNPRPGTIVAAMLLAVAIGVPIAGLSRDVVSGVAAGFGAGGIVTLRPVVYHSRWPRIYAVVLLTVYVFVVVRISAAAGWLATAVLPFVVLGLADIVADWKLAWSEEQANHRTDR
jgi:hypothetical protein